MKKKQRYYYIFNGKFELLPQEKLYDIIDTQENIIIESSNSAYVIKRRLEELNNKRVYNMNNLLSDVVKEFIEKLKYASS